MKILKQPMGSYQTNCYIVSKKEGELVIDPGVGALKWLKKHLKKPLAILNTHGHFDHVWSNQEVKEHFKIPLYCPKEDAFMLEKDPFGQGTPPSRADTLVEGDSSYRIGEFEVHYLHMPGHTPGNSVIIIGDAMFSGDFVFQNSIGRVDFPYSNPSDMKQSIKKFLTLKEDKTIYPGHGENTSVKIEQGRIGNWLHYI